MHDIIGASFLYRGVLSMLAYDVTLKMHKQQIFMFQCYDYVRTQKTTIMQQCTNQVYFVESWFVEIILEDLIS